MAIVATILGSFAATLSFLFAYFGVGVSFGNGILIYFATGLVVAAALIAIGMLNRNRSPHSSRMIEAASL